ncbi:branched-chain amino acid transport system ATP-binding protein [Ancylobacter sp. 3268]|uniref:ABC transporter ATP-binding protein n=1 Tax=Ancylobacter sp. 3268 TaxID=2817752 RepID=UPI002858147E|nr:ABC transporter ATP-binding protein [Ancylobacter sp. 3268]MDR6951850.1 branched-chain amino acid transport system ATP-binding protein [Ancylobacter sp. 3268]
MTEPILRLEGVSKTFGGLKALTDVSFALQPGEVVGLIGPNGAGKTTLVNVVTGNLRPSWGRILFEGKDVAAQKPHEAARRGLARTFQIVQPFPQMTVLENVTAGALFGGGAASVADARDMARRSLDFVGLAPLADRPAAQLALAARKRLELAKSLAMNPKVLMLDEVNAGLNSSEIDGALALIRRIAERGVTVLIIEHLMKVVLSLSKRLLVLHHGRMIADGPAREIVADERVIEAYLGQKYAAKLKELHHG